jgi:copper transport protein
MAICLRLALLLTCLLGLAVAAPRQAVAHAALTAASPADGAIVATAPVQLTLSFSEPVSPLVLKLISPGGASQTLARYALRDKTLAIEPPPGLGGGTHVLSWRVVSEDGHPVGGSVVFSIGAPSATVPAVAPAFDPVVRVALWFGKVGLYLGLFLGVGGAAFTAWVTSLQAAARRFSAALIVMGLVAVPLALAAQGLDALGAAPASVVEAQIWRAAASSSFGMTALIATIALLLGLCSLAMRAAAGRLLAAIALIGAGLALAASGHASAASPQSLMRTAVFLHTAGIALWAGALLPLMVALRRSETAMALDRFSRRIPFIVGVILASGAVLTVVQVETPSALVATAYGRVLLVKLVLVAALFGLAAWNRYRLTARASSGGRAAASRIRRVVVAEILLMLLVFGTAALWRFTPPPRALAIAARQPALVHIHTPKAMADITVTPGRIGPIEVSISLLNGEFGPLPAKELRVALSNTGAGIEAIERPAIRGQDGTWRLDGLNLPVPGRWTIELEVLVSDFEMLRLTETLEIRP